MVPKPDEVLELYERNLLQTIATGKWIDVREMTESRHPWLKKQTAVGRTYV